MSFIMKLYFIIPLFLLLPGCDFTRFIERRVNFCTPEFKSKLEENRNSSEFLIRCLFVNNTSLDYTDDVLYSVGAEEDIEIRWPNDVAKTIYYKVKTFTFYYDGFAFDWLNDTLYVIKDSKRHLLSLSLITNRTSSVLYFSDNPWQGFRNMEMKRIHLDPYEKFLFVLAECSNNHCPSSVIIRTGLDGEGLTRIIDSESYSSQVTLGIDVGNKRLYVGSSHRIHIHNYEGILLGDVQMAYDTIYHIAVVDNALFFTDDIGVYSHVFPLNQTHSLKKHETYVPISLNVEMFNFQVLDARVQRQKLDGYYICDRPKDCLEMCEVRSTGDFCIFYANALDRLGVLSSPCGRSTLTSSVIEPTILGNDFSTLGNFPWHAVLYKTASQQQFCGGTMISPFAVLTAAHCLTTTCIACPPSLVDVKDIMVSFGRTYRAWNITEETQIKRQVKKIILHGNYWGFSQNYPSDIALLILDSRVPVNEFVMPACLAINQSQLLEHQTLHGYVPGFGYTEECGMECSNFSERLKHTKVVVVNHDTCFNKTTQTDPSPFSKLTTDKFCVGNGSVSPVQQGDSGGGLTIEYKGLHFVIGVVSVKINKKQVNSYSFGALTNVSKHMDWLNRILPKDSI